MVEYIYFVKCPGCEDEHFDFFDEAKAFAMGCLSQKPIITQVEVCRNDFGECTDSCDLGTKWSWEDMMKDTEPEDMVFSKDETFGISEGLDDFDDFDIGPQIDEFDNSLDFDFEDVSTETLWVAENLNGGEIVAACWADSEDLAHRLLSQAFRERTGGDLRDCYIREAEADEPDYITDNPELLAEALTEDFDRVKAAAQCSRNCYDFYNAIAAKVSDKEIKPYAKAAAKFVKDNYGLTGDEAEELLWSGYIVWKQLHESGKKDRKPITESYATKEFEIPNFDAEITDEFEDEGIKGYNIVYSKNGTDIVEVEVWETDSPVAVNRNLHTPNLMQGYYSSFDAFASDLEYKTSKYIRVRESADRKPIPEGMTKDIPSDDYYVITTTEGTTRFYIKKINFGFEALPEEPYDWFTTDLSNAQTFSSRKMAGDYFTERKLADNVFALGPNNRRVRFYDYVKTPYECWLIDAGYIKEACSERKPIPEGMTIEQLVEEMEENEDTVECRRCGELCEKSVCRKEVGIGWVCDLCGAPDGPHDLGNEYDGGYPAEDSLAEAASQENYVDLEYDELEVTLEGDKRDADDWDEEEVTVEYTYRVPESYIKDTLVDLVTEEDVASVPGGIKALDDDIESWDKFLDDNFDALVEKYYDRLLDEYYDDAREAYESGTSLNDYRNELRWNYYSDQED